jgi:hypothetical protein
VDNADRAATSTEWKNQRLVRRALVLRNPVGAHDPFEFAQP